MFCDHRYLIDLIERPLHHDECHHILIPVAVATTVTIRPGNINGPVLITRSLAAMAKAGAADSLYPSFDRPTSTIAIIEKVAAGTVRDRDGGQQS